MNMPVVPKIQEAFEIEPLDRVAFDTIPSSPMLHFTSQAMQSLAANRVIRPNKNTSINYATDNKQAMQITSENKANKLTLTIDNTELFTKSNSKGLKKCFAFVLVQCNYQNYAKEIGFPLQALVDNGMYKSIDTARRGIKDNIEKIMALTFKGSSTKGNHTVEEQGGKLIYHYTIKNGYVTLSFNEKINVQFMAQYFTMLPKFAFALPNNAFSLIEYIFYLARQNSRAIKEQGYFNIGLRAIRDYLCLPHETETKDHSRLIKEPIEKAIEDIEDANNNSNFTITPIYKDDYGSVKEWLDGYIKVELKEEFADTFIHIADTTAARVAQSIKRREAALTMIEAKNKSKEAAGAEKKTTRKPRKKTTKQ
jgi:hypothetical protein